MGKIFVITEKRLIHLIQKFLNNHFRNDFVESFFVDYNKEFDRVVVNIMLQKDMDRENKSDFYSTIIDAVEGYFGMTPFVYSHYSKNYSKHNL